MPPLLEFAPLSPIPLRILATNGRHFLGSLLPMEEDDGDMDAADDDNVDSEDDDDDEEEEEDNGDTDNDEDPGTRSELCTVARHHGTRPDTK